MSKNWEIKTIVVNHVSFRMIHGKDGIFIWVRRILTTLLVTIETVNYDESPVHQMKVSSFGLGDRSLSSFIKPL